MSHRKVRVQGHTGENANLVSRSQLPAGRARVTMETPTQIEKGKFLASQLSNKCGSRQFTLMMRFPSPRPYLFEEMYKSKLILWYEIYVY